jgi:hypothetical protein
MSIDTTPWCVSDDERLRLIGKDDEFYHVENQDGFQTKIHKLDYEQVSCPYGGEGYIHLGSNIYEINITKRAKELALQECTKLYEEHMELIFKHRDIVFSNPEYYILQPKYIYSVGMYLGSVEPTLGVIFDSFRSGNHLYFPELSGYKDMYLVRVGGSEMSGIRQAKFWCDDQGIFVDGLNEERAKLLSPFGKTLMLLKKLYNHDPYPQIDFQDRIMQQLIDEIKARESS